MLCKSVVLGQNLSENLSHPARGKDKQLDTCTSSANDKETTRLDKWSEIGDWATHQPFERIPISGSRRKTNIRSSSHIKPLKKGTFWSSVQKDEDLNSASSDELLDDVEATDSPPMDMTDLIKDCHDETSKSRVTLPMGADLQRDNCRNSVVELLDHLQGRNSKSKQACKMVTRRKGGTGRHAVVRRTTSSKKQFISDEHSAECMNSGSSSDSKDIAQISRPAVVESERKTMADKFQEAFGCAPLQDIRSSFTMPKQTSTGLFGRLQQVMQRQREQDSEFLKKLQIEVWPKDEARCIDVKILSRSFEAKLTVCHCSLLENEESSIQNPGHGSFGKTWTIIFNSRVCDDVDLEVGNLIRIHPPWKEVQVLRCGEIIILAPYFSQI